MSGKSSNLVKIERKRYIQVRITAIMTEKLKKIKNKLWNKIRILNTQNRNKFHKNIGNYISISKSNSSRIYVKYIEIRDPIVIFMYLTDGKLHANLNRVDYSIIILEESVISGLRVSIKHGKSKCSEVYCLFLRTPVPFLKLFREDIVENTEHKFMSSYSQLNIYKMRQSLVNIESLEEKGG